MALPYVPSTGDTESELQPADGWAPYTQTFAPASRLGHVGDESSDWPYPNARENVGHVGTESDANWWPGADARVGHDPYRVESDGWGGADWTTGPDAHQTDDDNDASGGSY